MTAAGRPVARLISVRDETRALPLTHAAGATDNGAIVLHVQRSPFSLDPLIAEAKRRARKRNLVVVAAVLVIAACIAGATVALRSAGGGIATRARHRYTFSVESVNSSRIVNNAKYVSILSPVALSKRKLARTPLFNVTGAFHLVGKRAQGSEVCSFTKTITGSTAFPNANGKTVTVRVYGRKSPSLAARTCKAFETFSLSWLDYEKAHGYGASNAGLGPFNGVRTAQRAKSGADVLPTAVLAQIKQMNTQSAKASNAGFAPWRLLPDTARVLGKAPDGSTLYGLTDTRGDLCTFGAASGSCGPPLSRSHPITMGMANASPTTGGTFIVSGVAMDGVTSVSFTVWSKEVTVPIKHNVYLFKEPNTTAHGTRCVIAHFANGSNVNPFPEVPCPSSGK